MTLFKEVFISHGFMLYIVLTFYRIIQSKARVHRNQLVLTCVCFHHTCPNVPMCFSKRQQINDYRATCVSGWIKSRGINYESAVLPK